MSHPRSTTYSRGHYWDRIDECWRRNDTDARIEGNPPCPESERQTGYGYGGDTTPPVVNPAKPFNAASVMPPQAALAFMACGLNPDLDARKQ
jgi:hypothetical protein